MSHNLAELWQRRSINVSCNLEIANTAEALHAHVFLNGLEVEAGDSVLVHNAPTDVAFGESLSCDRQATVSRASWLDKLWVRLSSRFELTTLYEVSFSPDRLTALRRAAPPIPTKHKAVSLTPAPSPASGRGEIPDTSCVVAGSLSRSRKL